MFTLTSFKFILEKDDFSPSFFYNYLIVNLDKIKQMMGEF
ncbi:hypothetical protein M595_4633 [Lyngbya aestuarii BL J]|uniref:Uncharacterized protein n=1 Tax=Lyngbya aestuarii BL J TaxID=1348334 RepID=U7QE05_9CYAN|nr:hypothetical protein M595_4633 [Lyngbya aestuarii BL J]